LVPPESKAVIFVALNTVQVNEGPSKPQSQFKKGGGSHEQETQQRMGLQQSVFISG